jgi:hypothetical protein
VDPTIFFNPQAVAQVALFTPAPSLTHSQRCLRRGRPPAISPDLSRPLDTAVCPRVPNSALRPKPGAAGEIAYKFTPAKLPIRRRSVRRGVWQLGWVGGQVLDVNGAPLRAFRW